MTDVFVIAEAGVNHNGNLDLALRLVNEAAGAGADAVKFQAFSPEHLVTETAAKAAYQIKNDPRSPTQSEMLRSLVLSRGDFRTIRDHCHATGIEFLCSPFDQGSLDMLVSDLGVGRLKFGSGELTNAPLLWNAARTELPLILSTGMAELDDIALALGVIAHARGFGEQSGAPNRRIFLDAGAVPDAEPVLKRQVTLLHAVSDYPASLEAVNLRAMRTVEARFGLPVGYSDHTEGITAAIAAVALGAPVIEKHFTLDRTMEGPDHKASLEPGELSEMIAGIRATTIALGAPTKTPHPTEIPTRDVARKSLVAAQPICVGEVFSTDNLTAKRPADGLAPVNYWRLLGNPATRDYARDEKIDEPFA